MHKMSTWNGFRMCSLALLLALGFILPSSIIVFLDVSMRETPVHVAILEVLRKQLVTGENLLLIAILGLIPFVSLAGILLWRSRVLNTSSFMVLLISGTSGIVAFMIPAHISIWRPLIMGERVSSTTAVAFVFIPLYCTATMLAGLLAGRAIISILRMGIGRALNVERSGQGR